MGEAQRAADFMGPSAGAYEIVHVSAALVTLRVGEAFVAVWRSKPTAQTFEIQRSQLAAETARRRGRQLFLCIVEATADPPEQDVRDASAKMVSSPDLAACACVIEGTGFRAALTRTVLTGIAFMARSATPLQFFDSTENACVWLAKRGQSTVSNLVSSINHARAEAPAR